MAKSGPKLGARIGSPVWTSRGHALSEGARQALFDCLGLDASQRENSAAVLRVIREVEYALGFFAGGVQAFDNAPRPVDYVRAFDQLRKRAYALLDASAFHNDFYCDMLKGKLADKAVRCVHNK